MSNRGNKQTISGVGKPSYRRESWSYLTVGLLKGGLFGKSRVDGVSTTRIPARSRTYPDTYPKIC